MPRILIVEDNRDIATLYQRILMLHEVVICSSAETAIETLDKETFELIILDLHLPEQSGLFALEKIRSTPKLESIKILVISADDTLRYQCEAFSIQGWMTKPIEIDKFMTLVDKQFNSEQPI
jgi:DNA-binding response OmpR family regulator